VLEGKLTYLALDPGLVDRDRLTARPEGGDDRRDRVVVERDARDLGEDRRFPGLVAEAGLAAPRLARVGVLLAVAAVGERPVGERERFEQLGVVAALL